VWQIHFKVKEVITDFNKQNGKISKLEYDPETNTYFMREYLNLLEKK
jgi:hypothetical protein